jgi:hypothetical protein
MFSRRGQDIPYGQGGYHLAQGGEKCPMEWIMRILKDRPDFMDAPRILKWLDRRAACRRRHASIA